MKECLQIDHSQWPESHSNQIIRYFVIQLFQVHRHYPGSVYIVYKQQNNRDHGVCTVWLQCYLYSCLDCSAIVSRVSHNLELASDIDLMLRSFFAFLAPFFLQNKTRKICLMLYFKKRKPSFFVANWFLPELSRTRRLDHARTMFFETKTQPRLHGTLMKWWWNVTMIVNSIHY